MNSDQLRATIVAAFDEAAEQSHSNYIEAINDESVLLDIGLDSIDYATIVTRLEYKLGYDPFLLMEEPIYPRTFAEFFSIYDRFRDYAQ